jgi:thiol-disulfide isomerase/thioredoxin
MRLIPLALALTLAAAEVAAQDVGLEVGTRAPAAAVETLDGRPTDLASYIGTTPVLIEFWATWCPNCKQLEPQLAAIARKYGRRVKLLAVAVSVNQSPARVRAYAKRHPLPVEFVFDRAGKATGAYDAPATSYVLVIDRAGKVVYTGQGGDQDLDAAVRKANP